MMELNLEQKRLIKNKNMGHYLIKGIEGSGKTTVGICRSHIYQIIIAMVKIKHCLLHIINP